MNSNTSNSEKLFLPNAPKKLSCSNNKLINIPNLPNSLQELYISNNKLPELPELPNALQCIVREPIKLPRLPRVYYYEETESIKKYWKNIEFKYDYGEKQIFCKHFNNIEKYIRRLESILEDEKNPMIHEKKIMLEMFENYINENDEYEFLRKKFKNYYKSQEYKRIHQYYDFYILVPPIAYYLVYELEIFDINLLPDEIKDYFKIKLTKSGKK